MFPDENQVRIAAYDRWLRRGAPLWDDLVDWFSAESVLRERQNMVGEEFFQGRLGDIYVLSPIPYLCGRGCLRREARFVDVLWELNVSVTGSATLVLSSHTLLDINQMIGPGRAFLDWGLLGETLDGQHAIDARGIIISNVRFSVGTNADIPRYVCHFQRADIRPSSPVRPDNVVAFVQNLSFAGIEFSRQGTRIVADKFCTTIANREVVYQLREDHDRLKQLLEIDRIDRGLLSCISLPLSPNEAVEDGLRILENIEWLTSFFSQNRTFAPLVQLKQNGEPCGWTILEMSSDPLSPHAIVDNHAIPGGLRAALQDTYDRYCFVQGRIDLRVFVDLYLICAQQKHADIKLANLILAFEYLCTMLLTAYGRPPAVDASIQDKLRMLNGFLRFIPAALLDEELRADVRNPLFHTGALVGTDMRTKWEWFTRYFDLLIQIVCVVLQYQGQYISPINAAPCPTPDTTRTIHL
jgi:hypothetical protein